VIAHSPRPTVLLLLNGGGDEQDDVQVFTDVARRHRDRAQFATVDMALLGPFIKQEMGRD